MPFAIQHSEHGTLLISACIGLGVLSFFKSSGIKCLKIIGLEPIVVVKKRFGFKTFFSTNTYTAIPYFGILLW